MPAYNAAAFIGESLSSVLAQTFTDWELIVVDDGSTDNTAELVLAQKDSRIHYVYQTNQGPSAARNAALEMSSAEFVAFLDADDWWSDEALALLLAALKQVPLSVALAHGDWAHVMPDGAVGRTHSSRFTQGPGLQTLLLHNPFALHAALLRRRALEAVGGFRSSAVTLEDWDCWLRLAAAGYGLVHVPQRVAFYRRHAANRSRCYVCQQQLRLDTLRDLWDRGVISAEFLPLRAPSLASAHIDLCRSLLSVGEDAAAAEAFSDAVAADRVMALSVDAIYRLLHSTWEIGQTERELDEIDGFDGSVAEQRAGWLLAQAARLGLAPAYVKQLQAHVQFALGLAYYNHDQRATARVHFGRAIWATPNLIWRNPAIGGLWGKTFLPAAWLAAGRQVRRAL